LKTCPADAATEIKIQADYISPRNGGDGAVRDVIEKVMRTQDKWQIQDSTQSI
jgi:3-deoxy-D-manno-octulosonate 8-phosphate phosphatase (KDO 8-P phosphatase)